MKSIILSWALVAVCTLMTLPVQAQDAVKLEIADGLYDAGLRAKMEKSTSALLCMKTEDMAKTLAVVTTERTRIANLRCKDVVAIGRAPYTNWIGRMQETDKEIVMQSLISVGMEAYANRTMDKMSDGECQRVMIARALAQDTPIILLDEPTSFLDMPNRYELVALLRRLVHDEKKCIMFSTHELDIALSMCDSIALLDTPNLSCLTASEMQKSGYIDRLFQNENIRFDSLCGTMILKQ